MNCSPSWRPYDYADIEPSARAMHKGFQPEVGIIRRSALCRLCRCRHNRHSFAVNALLRWYQSGADVHAKLPLLATYMGHVSIVSTQYYLPFIEPLATAASDRFAQRYGGLITPASDGRAS
jgi:hypothetical protein